MWESVKNYGENAEVRRAARGADRDEVNKMKELVDDQHLRVKFENNEFVWQFSHLYKCMYSGE